MKTLLSFVIPCYRSEFTIEKVIDEVIDTVSQRSEKYDYEIICVNDCSPDGVLSVLKRLAAENVRIKVIDLAKNRGKHAAVMAGFAFCGGDYIVNIDDDFQCPAYELWRLLEPVENDECDLSTANYIKKAQKTWKNIGSRINSIMGQIMLEKPKGLRLENFTVAKSFVIKEMIKYDKPYPYLEGLLLRVTDRITVVEMNERGRCDNEKTGFTLHKSISLWLNGFTSFSVKPLRIASILGLLCALVGFAIMIIMVVRKMIDPEIMTGYTSLVALQLFIGGIVMILLGITGEYVGRIYICLNNAPQYVIKETVNIADKAEESLYENN